MVFKILNKVSPSITYLLLRILRFVHLNGVSKNEIVFILEFPECFNSFAPLIHELVKRGESVSVYLYKGGYIDTYNRSELEFCLPHGVNLLEKLPPKAGTFVLHNPYDMERASEDSFYRLFLRSRRTCFVSYGIEVAGARVGTHYTLPVMRYSDIVLVPSERIRANHLKHSGILLNRNRLLSSEHPYLYDVKRRLKGIQIKYDIFYSVHHSIDSDSDLCTFSKYGKIMLELFSQNIDLKIIFRPHPLFLQKIVKSKYNDLFTEIVQLDNVTLSTKNDFLRDILNSRKIITDVSSMIPAIQATKKKLLILTNNQENVEDSIYAHKEYSRALIKKFMINDAVLFTEENDNFYEDFTIVEKLCAG